MSHRFSKGFGALTARRLTEWGESAETVADRYEIWDAPSFTQNMFGPLACTIVSSTRMATTGADKWKWKYRLRAIQIDASDPDIVDASNNFDTETDIGINLAEQSNTETVASGITLGDLPGNFELQPIPVGAFVIVWVLTIPDDAIPGLPMFSRPGEFDGDCT